jgi:hypothetical protein
MNKAVAAAIKSRLTTTPWLGLLAGLVSAQETVDVVTDENTGNTRQVTYRYPVTADWHVLEGPVCDEVGLLDVSPNTGYKSILYFEDQGVSVPARQGSWLNFTSQLRLVCWLNTSQFNASATDVPAVAMADIVGRITGNPFNHGSLSRIRVSLRGIPQAGRALFSPYTFNEAVSQYLMPPYDAFAIDLNVDFSISVNCTLDTSTQPTGPC